MNDWVALDRVLQTDPRDVGCDDANSGSLSGYADDGNGTSI
jgi:hypothetical protein